MERMRKLYPPEPPAVASIRPRTGHEINPKTDELKIGDQLVIVVEGDRSRLASILGTGGDGEPANLEEPIVLADLLPSAFTVVSGNVRDRKEFRKRRIGLRNWSQSATCDQS